MDRVACTMQAIEDVEVGRLAPDAAARAIDVISLASPAPTWLFTLAAATGAAALAVIFGVEHVLPAVLIFGSAGAGAMLRRGLARLSHNVLIRPFCAVIIAGLVGALAVRFELSSSLWLVAVSIHGPGARTTCSQRRTRSYQWPYPSRCCPADRCRSRHFSNRDGIAAWTDAFR